MDNPVSNTDTPITNDFPMDSIQETGAPPETPPAPAPETPPEPAAPPVPPTQLEQELKQPPETATNTGGTDPQPTAAVVVDPTNESANNSQSQIVAFANADAGGNAAPANLLSSDNVNPTALEMQGKTDGGATAFSSDVQTLLKEVQMGRPGNVNPLGISPDDAKNILDNPSSDIVNAETELDKAPAGADGTTDATKGGALALGANSAGTSKLASDETIPIVVGKNVVVEDPATNKGPVTTGILSPTLDPKNASAAAAGDPKPAVGNGVSNTLGQIAQGIQSQRSPALNGAANAVNQASKGTRLIEDAIDGKPLAADIKAIGAAVGNPDVSRAVDVAQVLTGELSLTNGDNVKTIGKDFGQEKIAVPVASALDVLQGKKSLTDFKDVVGIAGAIGASQGGIDGQNVAEAAGVALAADKLLTSGVNGPTGQKNALGLVGAAADLFDNSKITQGAALGQKAIDVFNGGASIGNVASLATGALNLLGAKGPVIDALSTAVNVITNPIGAAAGFIVGGLNEALTWKPNEGQRQDVYGAVNGPGGNLDVIRVGENDSQQGKFGIKISQLNTDKISADQMGSSKLKEGEYITNGNTRATLTDNGLLQVEKNSNGAWQPTYQAGLPVNAKSETVLYVDQKDGKSKVALAGVEADGSTSYTPIWQSDKSAAVDGKDLKLNISGGGVLQVGTDDQRNRAEYTRSYNPGFLGIGGSYNRAENGGAITQKGSVAYETKGDYGNFNNANQIPKLQTVDPKAGTFDMTFKDQSGNDKALVSQQRTAEDTAKNSSLSFLEVQDTKYLKAAQNFNTTKVSSAEEVAAGIRSGKFVDVTNKLDYQSTLNSNGLGLEEVGVGDPTHPMNQGIKSALDSKEYRVFADKNDPNAVVRVETSKPLESLAYQSIDMSKVGVDYVARPSGRSFGGPATDFNKLNADIASGKIKEVSGYLPAGSLAAGIGSGRGAQQGYIRVFQNSDGAFFRTPAIAHTSD